MLDLRVRAGPLSWRCVPSPGRGAGWPAEGEEEEEAQTSLRR